MQVFAWKMAELETRLGDWIGETSSRPIIAIVGILGHRSGARSIVFRYDDSAKLGVHD